jgi:hypothetical protein
MKKIVIALFIGFSTFINAQNKISGKITDKDNNPVKGVAVYISELHKSSETDENGAYSINNVPNGTIKITFTLLGFTSQNKTLLVQNGDNKLVAQKFLNNIFSAFMLFMLLASLLIFVLIGELSISSSLTSNFFISLFQ